MDILDGTSTEGPILLGFTRAEFDEICKQLRSDGAGCTECGSGAVGAVLRFRATFAEEAIS